MTPEEANKLRLVAAEVIDQLWADCQTSQLELLRDQLLRQGEHELFLQRLENEEEPKTMTPIPQEFIKEYVDELINAAKLFGDSRMGNAAMIRADAIMDMVKAFRDKKEPKQ